MSKIISAKELAQIVNKVVEGGIVIDDEDQYLRFLKGLGSLVAEHFGGNLEEVSFDDDNAGGIASFSWDDSVPEDGGIFAEYDKDVTIEEWKNE